MGIPGTAGPGKMIHGIGGMSNDEIKFEVVRGGRFVFFAYCYSLVLVTIKDSSDIYFVRAGESRLLKGLPYMLLTLIAGWWWIPWGPIYTIQCLVKNFSGGEDVTVHVAPSAYVAAVSAKIAK